LVQSHTDKIPATGAYWRLSDKDLYFYVNGKQILIYKPAARSNDLLIYDDQTRQYYLLEDYFNRHDNILRPAKKLTSNNGTLWSNKDKEIFLYNHGERLYSLASAWRSNDLIIYDTDAGKYYLLEDYKNRNDNILFSAKKVISGNGTLWSIEDKKFYFYVNGERINSLITTWRSPDLLIYDTDVDKYYLLADYQNRDDNILRPAKKINSDNGTLWGREEKGFYFYVYGKRKNSLVPSWVDSNLFIDDTSAHNYYLLEDYQDRADNILRAAKRIDAVWKKQDNGFFLYVNGERINSVKTAWLLSDMLVYDTNARKYYVLTDYRKRAENILFPAKDIDSDNGSLWVASERGYAIYWQGVNMTNIRAQPLFKDLIAYDPDDGIYFNLDDFKHRQAKSLREAKVLKSTNGTMWIKKNNQIILFRDGELISPKLISLWVKNGVLAYDKKLKTYYFLHALPYGSIPMNKARIYKTLNGTLWTDNSGTSFQFFLYGLEITSRLKKDKRKDGYTSYFDPVENHHYKLLDLHSASYQTSLIEQ